MLTKKRIYVAASWLIVIWISKVFLTSIPYKFTAHPDTVHIFSTIGAWMTDTLSPALGNFFTEYGAIVVGSAELITSLVLLSPLVFFLKDKILGRNAPATSTNPHTNTPTNIRAKLHAIGGLVASGIMAGAVFFHLYTPLGVEVFHEGKSDGGSLFMAAFSILILGFVLFIVNFKLTRAE